jgi:hypothetical protein
MLNRRINRGLRTTTAHPSARAVFPEPFPFLKNAPGRIRTSDPRLRRPMLCPTELRAPVKRAGSRRRDGELSSRRPAAEPPSGIVVDRSQESQASASSAATPNCPARAFIAAGRHGYQRLRQLVVRLRGIRVGTCRQLRPRQLPAGIGEGLESGESGHRRGHAWRNAAPRGRNGDGEQECRPRSPRHVDYCSRRSVACEWTTGAAAPSRAPPP